MTGIRRRNNTFDQQMLRWKLLRRDELPLLRPGPGVPGHNRPLEAGGHHDGGQGEARRVRH